MEQPVVDAEIQMAAHEGIEFFSFYWYIDSATGKEQAISAPTKLFFSSSERGKLKFVLAPIIGADQPKGVISLETWQRTVVPALNLLYGVSFVLQFQAADPWLSTLHGDLPRPPITRRLLCHSVGNPFADWA